MAPIYKVGDHVKYHAVGGGSSATNNSTTTGKIVEIVTDREPAGDSSVRVQASKEDPRYVIKNDHTQKETAYKAQNIIGKD